MIDRSQGLNSQAAIENLTPDVPLPDVDQGDGNTDGTKQYSSPLPLDATRFLVSCGGPVLVRTIEGDCQSTRWPRRKTAHSFSRPSRSACGSPLPLYHRD